MNDTIKTPEDVTRRLKLPFLGLVPSVRGDKHPLLASSHVPHDFGESFRTLRTSLISKYPDDGAKILIVTSAQPLEGKTTTAATSRWRWRTAARACCSSTPTCGGPACTGRCA